MWEVLMAAKLVAQYGREEVRVITDANCPKQDGRGDIVKDLFKMGSKTSLLNVSMVVCVQRCDWKKTLMICSIRARGDVIDIYQCMD